MEKRKLSAIPRMEATPEMVEMADRMPGIKHMVTAELVEDSKILLLNFFEVSKLKKGKTEAAFRTFLSSDDYITQDLSVSKVKWLTAAFDNMQNFRVCLRYLIIFLNACKSYCRSLRLRMQSYTLMKPARICMW